ncbi:MAG: hypothetical protein EZS28_026692 [Streblomastix strix]|uniref:C2 domain-containing protein n=1 Tax=Streblomastix strix TaxID=222440 RepID=A0A5J4V5H9_9EUKA|nr:MAG: hypothetical protein EZS28_026692 [Streblomastix strix]
MIYLSEQEYIKRKEEEQNRKKREEEEKQRKQEELIKKKEADLKKKQELEQKRLEEEQQKQAAEDAKYVKGIVNISSIAVRDLIYSEPGYKADPFVVFKSADQKKQTTIAKETMNYEYKDEYIDLIYDPTKTKEKREVEIEVWDCDISGSNNLIGTASVDIITSFNKLKKFELFLQPKKSKKDQRKSSKTILTVNQDPQIGKVTFKMIYQDDATWVKQFKEAQQKKKDELINMKKQRIEFFRKKSAEKRNYPKGVVKFSKIAIRNIKKFDITKRTDPYVVLKMGNLKKQTSIARNKTDYDYQKEEYDLVYDPNKMQGESEAEIQVWKYDRFGKNDMIGAARIDV